MAGLDAIKFSFYGAEKESYEDIHRGLTFEQTKVNIENFFNVRTKLKARNPRVRMQFCPTLHSSHELEKFIEMWRPYMNLELGDRFYVTGLHNWAGGKENSIPKLPENQRVCLWPFKDIQILWDGTVVPCCYDFDGEVVLGTVNNNNIFQIWHSLQYESFREIWRKRKSYSIPICAVCDEPEGNFRAKPLINIF